MNEREKLSDLFRNFAIKECRGSSNLYEHLALHIAQDDELLEMAAQAKPGQPVPNLFFGAVQYLLLKGKSHALAEYYGSIVDHPKEPEKNAFFVFRDLCRQNQSEIIANLRSRLVQTNEVRRCAYLYPIFCFAFDKVKKPLSLIEIGTSAGLQLLWDKYRYSYGTVGMYGDGESDVHITSEIKGGNLPFLLPNSPPVADRIGLDLHINDLANSEDRLWLQSLIWPEHKERRELFEKAASRVIQQQLNLLEGDAVELLPKIVKQIPKDTAVCIFHTHVANQIPDDSKYKLIENIKNIGSQHDTFHLYNNMWDRKLHLDYFIDGVEHNHVVGETEGHGRWFSWDASFIQATGTSK